MDRELLEDAEHLGDVDAAGGRWWEAEDGAAAVGGGDGVAPDWGVGGHVSGGEDAAIGLHPCVELLGEGAAVEPVGSVSGDGAEGVGEVGLAEDGVGFGRAELGGEFWELGHEIADRVDAGEGGAVGDEALVGDGGGGVEGVGEGEAAAAGGGGGEGGEL